MGAPMGKRFSGGAETQPGGLFGFVKRATDYNETKEKVRGHKDPLRGFTDELRNQLPRTARISATQHRAVIRLRSPHPLNDEQWEELTFVPLEEVFQYTGMGNDTYATALTGLRARQAKQRKRIG